MVLRARTWGVLAVAITAAGCPGFGDQTLEELVGIPDTPPTWDDGVQMTLLENCVVCHTSPPQNGAPMGFRFDKYTTADVDDGGLLGALEMKDRIFARAVQNVPSEMPPGNPLAETTKALLGEWVMAGAPRSAPAGGGQ